MGVMVLVPVGKGVMVAVGTVAVKVAVGGMGVIDGVKLGGMGVDVIVLVGKGVGKAIFPVITAPALLNPIKATIQRMITRLPNV